MVYRARAHRSRNLTKGGTRSAPAIYDTFDIFERDQRVIARTPGRQFCCPNAKAVSGRDRSDPAPGACDLVHGIAGGVSPALKTPVAARLTSTTAAPSDSAASSTGRPPRARRPFDGRRFHLDLDGLGPCVRARFVRVFGDGTVVFSAQNDGGGSLHRRCGQFILNRRPRSPRRN